ncbi:MAG: hypothetical protein AAFU80_07580 [Pseudomonadota bacterium]
MKEAKFKDAAPVLPARVINTIRMRRWAVEINARHGDRESAIEYANSVWGMPPTVAERAIAGVPDDWSELTDSQIIQLEKRV